MVVSSPEHGSPFRAPVGPGSAREAGDVVAAWRKPFDRSLFDDGGLDFGA